MLLLWLKYHWIASFFEDICYFKLHFFKIKIGVLHLIDYFDFHIPYIIVDRILTMSHVYFESRCELLVSEIRHSKVLHFCSWLYSVFCIVCYSCFFVDIHEFLSVKGNLYFIILLYCKLHGRTGKDEFYPFFCISTLKKF